MRRYNPSYLKGLSNEEIDKRNKEGLVNYNANPKTKKISKIIFDNFFTYFNFLNLFLFSLIIFAGLHDNILEYALKNSLFVGVIIINSLIATIQEIISKKTLDKLSILNEDKIIVIREGQEKNIYKEELVLDDIVKLSVGKQIPADMIIVNGEIEVNESLITGEENQIFKTKNNLLLSGSFVVSGNCYAKVEHVGLENYASKITMEAKYYKKINSLILNSFTKLIKILSIIIIPIGILLAYNQYHITNNSISSTIFNTVGALIGMIPEGLLLLTSSTMALSVIKLSKFNVLVQQLYCIEILARVDVLCLDKTGTITEGSMILKEFINLKNKDYSNIIANFSNSFINNNATIKAIKEKYKITKHLDINEKIEFSSSRKFSGVFINNTSYYLGAPEYLLQEKDYKIDLEKYYDDRILVFAKNKNKLTFKPENLEVIGYFILEDKIRYNAKETLNYFKKQGVKLKIISGDNYKTVLKIANKIGIKNIKGIDTTNILDIENYSEEYDVFGRVRPEQKKLLIKSLQKKGHIVAMIGDGVNDVLALKNADLSIAVNSGSEAAKNVSQLIIMNSDFSVIPKILQEGRKVINNLERSSSLLLTKTIFTLILVVLTLFIRTEYFFLPLHLTLITSLTISIPSFILVLEKNDSIVSGNFLLNILGKSFTPGIMVVINSIVIYFLKNSLLLSHLIFQTILVINTIIIGFIFIYNLSKPFNKLKKYLLLSLITIFIFSIFIFNEFFLLNKINLLILFICIISSLCNLLLFKRLNNIINNFIKIFYPNYKELKL